MRFSNLKKYPQFWLLSFRYLYIRFTIYLFQFCQYFVWIPGPLLSKLTKHPRRCSSLEHAIVDINKTIRCGLVHLMDDSEPSINSHTDLILKQLWPWCLQKEVSTTYRLGTTLWIHSARTFTDSMSNSFAALCGESLENTCWGLPLCFWSSTSTETHSISDPEDTTGHITA